MHKRWKQLFLLSSLLMLLLPLSLWAAQSLKPQVILKSIKQLAKQEKGGDELYLLISDLNAGIRSEAFYTMPGGKPYLATARSPHPVANSRLAPHQYWGEKHLPKLKNVLLWSRSLANGQATQLMVTLVEADMPPFNLDDSLGTVKINLENGNGKLSVAFLPYSHAQLTQAEKLPNGHQYTVQIKNGKAAYLLQFIVK